MQEHETFWEHFFFLNKTKIWFFLHKSSNYFPYKSKACDIHFPTMDCLCFNKLLELHHTECRISTNLSKRKQSNRKNSVVCCRLNIKIYKMAEYQRTCHRTCVKQFIYSVDNYIELLFKSNFINSNSLHVSATCALFRKSNKFNTNKTSSSQGNFSDYLV